MSDNNKKMTINRLSINFNNYICSMKKGRMNKETAKKLSLEASKYFLDISKLIFAGIALSGVTGITEDKTNLIIWGILAVIAMALVGFGFFIKGTKK